MDNEKEQLEVKKFRENLLKNPNVFREVRPLLVLRARRPETFDPYQKLWDSILENIPKWMFNLPNL